MCGLCNDSQSAILSEASEIDTEKSSSSPPAAQRLLNTPTRSAAALGWDFDGKTRDKWLARLEQKRQK